MKKMMTINSDGAGELYGQKFEGKESLYLEMVKGLSRAKDVGAPLTFAAPESAEHNVIMTLDGTFKLTSDGPLLKLGEATFSLSPEETLKLMEVFFIINNRGLGCG